MGNNEMNNAPPKVVDGVGRPAKHDPERAESDVNASLVDRLAEASPSPAVHAEREAEEQRGRDDRAR